MQDAPVVKLCYNPWKGTLKDGVVLEFLISAAIEAAEKLKQMIENGEVDIGDTSFGAVFLDPTRPRWQKTIGDRIFAVIEIGPRGHHYLLNGAAKADAHDRHGVLNGILVDSFSHCLGDGDFTWGTSAEYNLAIGGGSGLSGKQDGEMLMMMLKRIMDNVRKERDAWLKERRKLGYGTWYNQENEPGDEYIQAIDGMSYTSIPAVLDH